MTRWEYLVVGVVTERLQTELNEAGAAGWELVTSEYRPGAQRPWVLVFKRPAGQVTG